MVMRWLYFRRAFKNNNSKKVWNFSKGGGSLLFQTYFVGFFFWTWNLRSNHELIHIQNEALLDPFLPELWVCWLLLCIAASLDVKWILEILNCQKRSNKDCQKSKFVLSWNHKVFHHYTASLNNLHLQSNIFGFLKVKYFHISIWRIYSYSLCEHNPIILKSNDTLSFRTALHYYF